ncbi:hypothetical protein NP233_g791 [Leucocoprinus birnbaumii]|uniref:NAD(P)-binding domain-containing protein n=1 Tax=Leucocoprinus birnbaumii TaxID=56174 RepID=A0AAD5W3W3_9AGAR|nr:hypothetical protein NP233_g791 [Leucocoprinus birnbaumii]
MRFLVLGGTGPCGVLLIRELLSQFPSEPIVVYARSPQKLPADLNSTAYPTLIIIKGDLSDKEAIERALEGVDVVLSALGPLFGQPSDTPLARGYGLVIDAMEKNGIKRLIALGTTSIADPADKSSLAYTLMINAVKTGARSMYKDIVAVGETIRSRGQNLDWTLVRVPILTNSDNTKVIAGSVGDGKVGTTLSRKGFATFVVEEVKQRQWVKKAPLITSA